MTSPCLTHGLLILEFQSILRCDRLLLNFSHVDASGLASSIQGDLRYVKVSC